MRGFWFSVGWLGIMVLSVGVTLGLPEAFVLRFADTAVQPELPVQLTFSSPEADVPEASASTWLQQVP